MVSVRPQSAFSLVELSIVLVILGLLVGGVLSGHALIRASELRAALKDVESINASVNQFKDKYLALPGDMANATQFFGAFSTCPRSGPAASFSPATTVTCNGDGDGIIIRRGASATSSESWLFWQHMYGAGLIWGGPYTGFYANFWLQDSIINAPSSKAGRDILITVYDMAPNIPSWDPGSSLLLVNNTFSGRVLMVGKQLQANAATGPWLTPTEAWNIDTKVDDGRPATGSMLMYRTTTAMGYAPTDGTLWQDCVTTNVVSTSAYNLAVDTKACHIIMKASF